jgi:hypothetical protein
MTAHHEPKRDRRHQTRPIESGAERHAGWRRHGFFLADQHPRLTWLERELVRQPGAKLYHEQPKGSE